jgi:endo-1,4-beta-xylanase
MRAGTGRGGGAHRRVLAALAAVALTGGAVAGAMVAAGQAGAATTTLRSLAEAKGKYFGVGAEESLLTSNSSYANIAATQFDMITPGNEMKWASVEATQGTYTWGPADQMVAFATANNERVRGHNLVWNSQLPSWLPGSFTSAQLQALLQKHITDEVTHFKGEIYTWDVVNEPFNSDGSYVQDLWYNAFGGNSYIASALTWAHAADPNALLCLNDYNIEGVNTKSTAMYNLVKSLLAAGVPVSCVGLESHFVLGSVPSDMQANIARFAALGVHVQVTEVDDRILLPATTANLAQQATDYGNIVTACLGVTLCDGVTVWGIDDGNTWVTSTFPGYGAPLMWDANYATKPAYNAVVTALGGTVSSTSASASVSASASASASASSGGTSGCTVTYVPNQWTGGFTANVTVKNTGSAAWTAWTVTFTFAGDQKITNAWNVTTTQSGAAVSAANMSYNGSVAAGASTNFGFQGTWTSSDASPTSFKVNGTTCT